MAWDVMSGVTKTAWDVMSGVTKTAWDVLSGVANLCGMFCPGCQKMAWDVLSRDVLSGSRLLVVEKVVVGRLRSDKITITRLQQPGILPALSLYFNQLIQILKIYILIFFHIYYSKFLRENLAKNKLRVDGQFGVRENPNNALTGTRHFIGTKLIVQPNDTDLEKNAVNI